MRVLKSALLPIAAIYLAASAPAWSQIRPDVEPTKVLIETTANAEIFLDDMKVGDAASTGIFTIVNAKPGSHMLRVVASGKRPLTRKISVAPGKINRFSATLEDFTGDLEVLTAPDSEVLLDGKPAGTADGSGRLVIRGLKAMGYKLRAARAGYNAEERPVDVVAGLLSTFTVDLKRIEAAEEGASAPPPEYVMQRRLSHRQARELRFGLNSLELVSVGLGNDTGIDNSVDRVIEWDPGAGRRLNTIGGGYLEWVQDESPDLHWTAIKSRDDPPVIRILDTATGQVTREWPGFRADFTADSKRVVIRSEHGSEAVYYEIASGKRLQSPREHATGRFFVSPYGHWLVSWDDDEIDLRDAETLKIVQKLPTLNVRGAAFSPNGRWVAIIAETKIELWEIATGRQGRSIEGAGDSGRGLQFARAVFTPDSRYIISTHGKDLRMWDAFTGQEVRKWPLQGADEIALSPDGRWLAVTVAGGVTVWRRVD